MQADMYKKVRHKDWSEKIKMGMLPEKFVKAFAERTLKNLDAIEALRILGVGVFETTQLVNSCLGLLVFPRQRYIANIPNNLTLQGWPVPVVEQGEQVGDVRNMIENMRHAVAHCNLEFIGDDRNEIQGIRMWNSRTRWKVKWSVENLRKFVIKFSDMLIRE